MIFPCFFHNSAFRRSCQAADQLRQRVAWALVQIFVVAPDDATMSHTEMCLGRLTFGAEVLKLL
jgi:hypothetical protein